MQFRVTQHAIFQQSILDAQRHTRQISLLQQQLSSGKKISKPSDDPLLYSATATHQARANRLEAYQQNVAAAEAQLNNQVSSLLAAKDLLVRAKEIALEAPQQQEPEVLAAEVDHILEQLLQIGNAQFDGRYIFAGTAVDQPPFVHHNEGGVEWIEYRGDSLNSQTLVSDHLSVAVHRSGEEIFGSEIRRQQTIFIGTTGVQPGVGTDSATGKGTLVVRHTATNYSAGSGLAPGTDSVDGDTVLGALGTHQVTLVDTSGTGAFGTIALNGGSPVAFTSSDTNLRVEGPDGEVIYVDTTAIAAGFSGTIDVGGDGALSIDDGATEIPITFTTNQMVVDSRTGKVTFVDSSGIRRAGVEHVEYPGTADAFETLLELRDDILNKRSLQGQDYQQALSRRIGDLDRAIDSVLAAVGEQSAALAGLESTQQRLEDLQLAADQRISELSGTDFTEAAVKLQEAQNLLQFTFASSLQAMSTSLLDFLR